MTLRLPQPHPLPAAVCWDEDHAGFFHSALHCAEGGVDGVAGGVFEVEDGAVVDAGSSGEIALGPAEEGSACLALLCRQMCLLVHTYTLLVLIIEAVGGTHSALLNRRTIARPFADV